MSPSLRLFAGIVAIGLASCGDSNRPDKQEQPISPTASSPEISPTEAVISQTPQPSPKWSVGRQLVNGLPWGSENESEGSLLANVEESEATPDQRLVLALNDLAGWYRGQKRYDEAEKVYQRVLDLQRSRMGDHYDAELSSNDLGVLYTESGRFDEAEEAFKRVLGMWDSRWDQGIRTEDEAISYHNYSMLLEKMGRSAEAKAMEDKADAIMAARKKALEDLAQPVQTTPY